MNIGGYLLFVVNLQPFTFNLLPISKGGDVGTDKAVVMDVTVYCSFMINSLVNSFEQALHVVLKNLAFFRIVPSFNILSISFPLL